MLANVASVAMPAHLLPDVQMPTCIHCHDDVQLQGLCLCQRTGLRSNIISKAVVRSLQPYYSRTYCMSTYIQIGLIWLIYGVAMLTLEVRAGLLERLYKDLLQLGQPLSPTRNALHRTRTLCVRLGLSISSIKTSHWPQQLGVFSHACVSTAAQAKSDM